MATRKIEKGSFSGHETFTFRYTWLKKAVSHVNKDPGIFQREDALVKLGVGKNMVRSIKHWATVFGIIENVPQGHASQVTDLGNQLFDDNGWDPKMEDPATLWILHWQLSKVGKLLPEDLYLHRTAIEYAPPLLRLVVEAAEIIVGHQSSELLKISRHGKSMSFLWYPDFDEVPHPELKRSLRVYLPKTDYQIRDFSQSENPPILHRKETFVVGEYPLRAKFEKLTKQEEKAGLLENPPGFKKDWELRLASSGYLLRGHTLNRNKNP